MFKIRENYKNFYWCDHLRTYNLKKYTNSYGNNEILYLGQPKLKFIDKFFNKRKIYIDFEEPNRISSLKFNSKIADLWKGGDYDYQFQKIFSICPYTSDWLNEINANQKRSSIFHPTNEDLITTSPFKDIDIIYTGNIHGMKKNILEDILKPITKFKHRIISSFGESKLVTDKNITNKKKFELLGRSKISIMQFLLFPDQNAIKTYKCIKNINKNKAFDFIDMGIIPQMKSRPFEAAFSKTLMLVRSDQFNLIEKYFNPNDHFIYFNDENLEKLVRDILKNFYKYEKIVNDAYEFASKKYSRIHFLSKVLSSN